MKREKREKGKRGKGMAGSEDKQREWRMEGTQLLELSSNDRLARENASEEEYL